MTRAPEFQYVDRPIVGRGFPSLVTPEFVAALKETAANGKALLVPIPDGVSIQQMRQAIRWQQWGPRDRFKGFSLGTRQVRGQLFVWLVEKGKETP